MAELSPLRRRMIDDMTIRNLSPATQRSYVHAVAKFSRHFGRSPDRLGLEDVRAFQVHLVSTGISWPALNQTVCALRFFYGVTLGHAEIPERINGKPLSMKPLPRPSNGRMAGKSPSPAPGLQIAKAVLAPYRNLSTRSPDYPKSCGSRMICVIASVPWRQTEKRSSKPLRISMTLWATRSTPIIRWTRPRP